MDINKQKIIVVVGPTASGKSDLAIKLAKKFNGEIISADSRQVYRGMDIGAGKVRRDRTFPVPKSKVKSKKLKVILRQNFYSGGIRHHLIDIANPKKQFTASDFKKLGEKAIKEIVARGKVPIIVGGTGFYIDVLLGRMNIAGVPPNKQLRVKFDKLTAEKLFKKLSRLDPERAKIIDRHNKRRLIRAIEIALSPKSDHSPSTIDYNQSRILWIGLKPQNLEKKIKKRLDIRLNQGMIREVERLHNPPTGEGVGWKRLDDLGLEYRWISRWLIQNTKIKVQNDPFDGFDKLTVVRNSNHKTQDHAERSRMYDNVKIQNFKNSDYYQKLLTEITKYSKRQITWFKKNQEINWLALTRSEHSRTSEVEGLNKKSQVTGLVERFLN